MPKIVVIKKGVHWNFKVTIRVTKGCDLFRKLYVTFVRPYFDYTQVECEPHLMKYINMIENVQIRATKLVDRLSELVCTERLKSFNLLTMVYCRVRDEMIE